MTHSPYSNAPIRIDQGPGIPQSRVRVHPTNLEKTNQVLSWLLPLLLLCWSTSAAASTATPIGPDYPPVPVAQPLTPETAERLSSEMFAPEPGQLDYGGFVSYLPEPLRKPPRPVFQTGGSWVVSSGDSLWEIAAAQVGTSEFSEIERYWRELVLLNQENLSSNQPDLIYPGELIRLPSRP